MTQTNGTKTHQTGTVIVPCKCVHADQDQLHGSGQRVHNRGKKMQRCTVCGLEKHGMRIRKAPLVPDMGT